MPAVSVECMNMYYPETELSTRCCHLVTKKCGTGKGPIASRHLVCGTCSSWLQFDTLGCTIPWAEMKGSTVFKCKGCTEVARLVGEVEDLRKMVESLKRMVTGQGLEETNWRNRGSRGNAERS